MAATVAGIPTLSRLKSTTRYACLAPPPMKREVTRPTLLRPPVRSLRSTSAFSGRSLVMSSRVVTVWNRRVGVTGLYDLIGINISLGLRIGGVIGENVPRALPLDPL